MRGILIPTDGKPVETDIEMDSDGSTLHALQRLVGGNIEPVDLILGDDILACEGISIYVNEEGLYSCPPNRALYATKGMEEAGYLSQMDFRTTVREGELYTILFGDLVAVGFDPVSGENRDLTDAEAALVQDYFTKVSLPGTGIAEVITIQSGTRRESSRPAREQPSLCDEAESSRAAADALSGDRADGSPNRSGKDIG